MPRQGKKVKDLQHKGKVRAITSLEPKIPGLPSFIGSNTSLEPPVFVSLSSKEPSCTYTVTTPIPKASSVVLLHLTYSSPLAQQSALSRIGAFYESSQWRGKYLSLADVEMLKLGKLAGEPKKAELCYGYVGFNFPLEIVVQWLQAMWDTYNNRKGESKTIADKTTSESQRWWWEAHCNREEVELLNILVEKTELLSIGFCGDDIGGCGIRMTFFGKEFKSVSKSKFAKYKFLNQKKREGSQTETGSAIAPYIISHISTSEDAVSTTTYKCRKETIAHELAHFAYHACPGYVKLVGDLYKTKLSLRAREYVECLLSLAGYAQEVLLDEVQAYLGVEGLSVPHSSVKGKGRKGKAREVDPEMIKVKKELDEMRNVIREELRNLYGKREEEF